MWSAPRRTSRGGQRRYSDLAIETCLTLRTAYRLALRQTQGLMVSIGTLMGLDIRVPDGGNSSKNESEYSQATLIAVEMGVRITRSPQTSTCRFRPAGFATGIRSASQTHSSSPKSFG